MLKILLEIRNNKDDNDEKYFSILSKKREEEYKEKENLFMFEINE